MASVLEVDLIDNCQWAWLSQIHQRRRSTAVCSTGRQSTTELREMFLPQTHRVRTSSKIDDHRQNSISKRLLVPFPPTRRPWIDNLCQQWSDMSRKHTVSFCLASESAERLGHNRQRSHIDCGWPDRPVKPGHYHHRPGRCGHRKKISVDDVSWRTDAGVKPGEILRAKPRMRC